MSVLQVQNLKMLFGIRHGFFTRQEGENVAAQIGVNSSHLIRCQQVHSSDVVTVTKLWDEAHRPKADALVTVMEEVALGVITADCAPILFVDPVARVIGAAHAGWRGAISGVIENTLAAMEKLSAQRENICAAVGPCIGPDSYEVGTDFSDIFLKEDQDNAAFFKILEKQDHLMFDLPAYVTRKIQRGGVDNISLFPADTYKDQTRFFSHRRSRDKGRQISVIVMHKGEKS